MDLRINTKRLTLVPFNLKYLEDYHREFTPEVTRYQYPDPFPNLETARKVLSGFMEDMERGEMLELAILGQGNEFMGSAEVFGLRSASPELGLWLKEAVWGIGYGREALEAVLQYLDGIGEYEHYIYEADWRNAPSIRLAERFPHEKGGLEKVTTDSGRELMLQSYLICSRR